MHVVHVFPENTVIKKIELMPRKQQPQNQLALDYSVSGNRMVVCLGHQQSYIASEYLFSKLKCHEICLDSDIAEVISAASMMDTLGSKLPYPAGMQVAELSNWDDDFIGFSAIVDQKGWVFISKSLNACERNYFIHLLTLSLGLNTFYTTATSLKNRCEKVVVDRLVTTEKLASFFIADDLNERKAFSDEVENAFQLPYNILLKSALERGVITLAQYYNLQITTDQGQKRTSEPEISNEEMACVPDGQLFIEGFGF
jgi:hypothetical protein